MTAPLELLEARDQAPKIAGVCSAQWLTQDLEAEWDAFVLAHPSGSVYHTSRWKRTIEQAFQHIRGRFLVLREKDSGRIQGGLPVYQVSSWLLGSRLASVPFATVCDPLVATGTHWAVLVPELEKECVRTSSNKMTVRAVLNAGTIPPSFTGAPLFKHHCLPLDGDFDALCRSFNKQSVRQKAEKARRAGVTVEECSDKEGMMVSHSLLATTRRRLSLPPMPGRFFESMRSNLRPEHLRIFLAYQNARPVACHLVLIFKDQWISEYSANADGAITGINQLLYLETIRRACAEGARKFSFGRTSITNVGLLSYKRRWGTTEENLTDYTLGGIVSSGARIMNEVSTSEDSSVYRLCRGIIAHAPMPLCKLVGNFCYRHLG